MMKCIIKIILVLTLLFNFTTRSPTSSLVVETSLHDGRRGSRRGFCSSAPVQWLTRWRVEVTTETFIWGWGDWGQQGWGLPGGLPLFKRASFAWVELGACKLASWLAKLATLVGGFKLARVASFCWSLFFGSLPNLFAVWVLLQNESKKLVPFFFFLLACLWLYVID